MHLRELLTTKKTSEQRGAAGKHWLSGLLMAVLMLAMFAGQAVAQTVAPDPIPDTHPNHAPILLSGNVTCSALGYFGAKKENSPTGTFLISNMVLETGTPSDPGNSISISNVTNNGSGESAYFDWSSSLGIDFVLVKGTNNSDQYLYFPESFGDVGLHPPFQLAQDGTTKEPAGISHISFCYDYELKATKTAATSYKRTYSWTLSKTVDSSSLTGFVGDSFTSGYTVTADQTVTDSDWAVSGTISVSNPAPAAITFSVSDLVAGNPATVTCPTNTLAQNESTTCTYTAALTGTVNGTNTASVTVSGTPFAVGATTASASYTFGDPTTVVGDASVDVSDTNSAFGGAKTASGDETYTYQVPRPCSTNPDHYTGGVDTDIHTNTAYLTFSDESSLSAEASVTVTCYAPVVEKDAKTSYTRDHKWTIDKSVAPEVATGFLGNSFSFGYQVDVKETETESGFNVAGTITVKNPHPTASMTVSVADSIVGATLDCGGSLTVPANSSASCSYSADTTKEDGRNTATVTLNSVGFTASADYVFGDPTTVTGSPTVNVTDTNPVFGGPKSTSGDATYSYEVTQSCSTDTSFYTNGIDADTYLNKATITETAASDDASVTVTCYIPATANVKKTTTEGPESIGQGPFTFVLSNGGPIETQTLSGAGTVAFAASLGSLTASITYSVTEELPAGWFTNSPACSFTVDYPGSAGKVYDCSFDNREAARVTVQKLTNGALDAQQTWAFAIFAGAHAACGVVQDANTVSNPLCSSFLGSPLATSTTAGDVDGILEFAQHNLDPTKAYTVCEASVPASWTAVWSVGDTLLTPYNPNASDYSAGTPFGQNLGHSCVDIGAGALPQLQLVSGTTLALKVDNTRPGGDPRTPGYWKNWNTCTGGNQVQTSVKNGGRAAGFWLLDDTLAQTSGDLDVSSCTIAVSILDDRDLVTGKKVANDVAYHLARNLLAAGSNLTAGAETCTAITTAATAAQALLDQINFNGTGSYLTPPKPKAPASLVQNYADARSLATTIDLYNNGLLCQ